MNGLDAGSVSANITPSAGGTTVALAKSLLAGAEALVAAALFAALAALIVRQFIGSNDDLRDTSHALKRACGMLAIVFVIVFLARGATDLASSFSSSNGELNRAGLEVSVTHHGREKGDWADGETREFGSLGSEGQTGGYTPPHDNSDDL